MDIKRFLTIALTLVLVMGLIGLVASPASAQEDDRFFCPATSGDWNSITNWDTNAACTDGNNGVPGEDDRVFIQSGQTCIVDFSDTVDTLDVASTAKLVIETGKKLTLDGTHDSGISTIDGNIKLKGSGSEIVIIFKDHTFDGSGTITGFDSAAVISIDFLEKLTNKITIHGNLVINGSGVFDNQGTVRADGGNVLELNSASLLGDTSGATWAVAPTLPLICDSCLVADSSLRFNSALPGGLEDALAGNFSVSAGLLDVDTNFTTTGRLTHSGGRIEVASSRFCTFDFDE